MPSSGTAGKVAAIGPLSSRKTGTLFAAANGLNAVASTFCFNSTGRFWVTVCPKFEPNTPIS